MVSHKLRAGEMELNVEYVRLSVERHDARICHQ